MTTYVPLAQRIKEALDAAGFADVEVVLGRRDDKNTWQLEFAEGRLFLSAEHPTARQRAALDVLASFEPETVEV